MSSRKKVIWKNIRGIQPVIGTLIATVFGAGFSPLAPGTMGSLAGLPIAFFTQQWQWEWRLAFWALLILVGSWAAQVFDRLMQSHDHSGIVIDEVVGLGISAWTAGNHPATWCGAFVFFRFFDILKPPPIRQVDQWSKHQSAWAGGFGVIADDMIAGFQSLGLIVLLQWAGILPR